MTYLIHIAAAITATAVTMAAPAAAQNVAESGPYAVARAGVQVDSELRFRDADRLAPSSFSRDVDYKPGFTGEIGGGYDLGGFRIEGTVGYTRTVVDEEQNSPAGFDLSGRQKSLDLGVAAYADFNRAGTVRPYVGGGIGASRVDMQVASVSNASTAGSGINDRDWGFRWHLDAGVGLQVAQNTMVELGARYTRTSSLRFDGQNGLAGADPQVASFEPRLSGTAVTLGLRQQF